jgi:hypothetical protein
MNYVVARRGVVCKFHRYILYILLVKKPYLLRVVSYYSITATDDLSGCVTPLSVLFHIYIHANKHTHTRTNMRTI